MDAFRSSQKTTAVASEAIALLSEMIDEPKALKDKDAAIEQLAAAAKEDRIDYTNA
jgi:hypothetical protein